MAVMTDEDLRKTVEAVKAFSDELCSSPEKARAYLISTGFLTPEGQIAEAHRPLA